MRHLAGAGMLIWPLVAGAFPLDVGISELSVGFNNTLRYTHGLRMAGRDPRIAGNALYDQGDALFGPHDAIARRFDWLGEFDLRYRRNLGLRVSAAAWFDSAYGENGAANPEALPAGSVPSYRGNVFTPHVERYYRGPSGEFLDAFAYGAVDLGDTLWNLKLGRHAVVWGESLFGSTHAVAYAQTPVDGLKAIANPGASAKETALPINQLSLVGQIDPELSLLGQYLAEWRPNRLPEGGTYFGLADSALLGPDVGRLPPIEGRSGDFGLGFKWSPAWLDGTLGGYWRRFDDKMGWVAQAAGGGVTRAVYARNLELWGVSLAKNMGGVAVGAELSYRRNDPLTSDQALSAAGSFEGARGHTWHGLLNAVLALGPSGFYDSASLAGELSWSKLDRVTQNPALFRAAGTLASCNTQATLKGCADDDYFALAVSFVPVWLQVLPGVDLEMPLFFSTGLRGNAPGNAAGSEAATTWKIGLTARMLARHQIDLAYTAYDQKLAADPASPYGSRVLGAPYRDKAWLSVTLQTFF